MDYSITDTYKMKREILNFSKKISSGLAAPDRKFFGDMTYGILASQSCLLTRISHTLQEDTKKIYTVDRLSTHLQDGVNPEALQSYLQYVRRTVPSNPVIHIDDSDVIKPEGYHFESLGIVRDGSRSTSEKSVYAIARNSRQNQQRTDTLTDTDILELAATEIPVDNLDAAQADALNIFKKRLGTLRDLMAERQELGSTYKEQQFGANVDRNKAAETLKKMRALDAQIQEAESKVLSAETSPALKKVLPRARRIVEQHQKEKDDVILKRWRDRRNNAAVIKKYRERIAKDVTDISNWIISPSGKNDMKHLLQR